MLSKSLLADLWFGTVMRVTSLLPEIKHTHQLRGWMIRRVCKGRPNNLQVSKGVRIFGISNVTFGDDVFLSTSSWILAKCPVNIESEVMLGPMSVVIAGNHTKVNGSYRFGPAERAPITIGHGSWLGAHAVVTKGVVLGKGVCVGAGGVVGKSFPDGAFVGGVPAKLIKQESL